MIRLRCKHCGSVVKVDDKSALCPLCGESVSGALNLFDLSLGHIKVTPALVREIISGSRLLEVKGRYFRVVRPVANDEIKAGMNLLAIGHDLRSDPDIEGLTVTRFNLWLLGNDSKETFDSLDAMMRRFKVSNLKDLCAAVVSIYGASVRPQVIGRALDQKYSADMGRLILDSSGYWCLRGHPREARVDLYEVELVDPK